MICNPCEVSMIKPIQGETINIVPENTSIASVIKGVCSYYRVSPGMILGRNRMQPLCFARHVCMYILRKEKGLTLLQVGSCFHRDHTTVINAVQTVTNLMETDSFVRNQVRKVYKRVFNM